MMAKMIVEFCCNCGIEFHITDDLYRRRVADRQSFWCPNGHPQSYRGESEAEKQRRRAERAEQSVAMWREEAEQHQRSNTALKGAITKMKRRSAHGTCPCCHRTFANMARHMRSKHPEYVKEQGLKAVS